MKLVSTLIASALAIGVPLLGCSDDESQPAQSAGTSGRGAGATGGGGASGSGGSGGSGGSAGASGGSGGRGGTAGTGGTAGADGGQCSDRDPAEISACKGRGNAERICSSLVNCSCDKCACILARCEASPGCLALRRCVITKGCCSLALLAIGCAGEGCEGVCAAEIGAAGQEMIRPDYSAFQLAIDLDNCVFGLDDAGAHCDQCPRPDAGDAAGGG